ncbi:DUF3040 domain-containing protein [Actinosynnema sp. NPDC059797]
MPGERESEALRQIQRRLWDEDPEFAHFLESSQRHLRSGPRRRVPAFVVDLAGLLAMLMLVLGLPVAALVFAAAGVLAWVVRRRAALPGPRP